MAESFKHPERTEHEKKLLAEGPFNNSEYFSYWLGVLRDTEQVEKKKSRNGNSLAGLDADILANPEGWTSLMKMRNAAGFISDYMYNQGCMSELEGIPDVIEILTSACIYLDKYDSRTSLPHILNQFGHKVPEIEQPRWIQDRDFTEAQESY